MGQKQPIKENITIKPNHENGIIINLVAEMCSAWRYTTTKEQEQKYRWNDWRTINFCFILFPFFLPCL